MFQIKVVSFSRARITNKLIYQTNERQMQFRLLGIHIFMQFKPSNMIG